MGTTPTAAQQREFGQVEARTLSADKEVSVDLPGAAPGPERPPAVTHLSTPSYDSPLRHHKRQPSTPRQVKETLNARSEYTNSEDDGTAIHRINQYVIKQEIGRGSFGAVHLAVDQYNQEYAVKEFSKARLRKRAQSSILRRPGHVRRQDHLASPVAHGGFNAPLHRRSASDIHDEEEAGNPLYLIREEIAIMKKLNHSNLAALYEVLDDPSEDSLYMVMEMCKRGVVMKVEVGDRADPYDPESCRCWFRDLILGVEYLHEQGIVHRDIKPDNLLLTDDDVLKIVDFGVSEMFEKTSNMTTKKSAGSPAFLPPELCVTNHGAISGKAADIWSMGITLYCLYYGKVPFEKSSVLDLYDSIKTDPPDFSLKEADDDFQDLMQKILEKDPVKRIQMEELRQHPWVTKHGVDPLLSVEENTADMVEPPTAEEVNRAITGNFSNLIVVMKAVRKFRGLLARKRPYLMDSVLGAGARLVQPPLSLNSDSPRPLKRNMRSDDAADRRSVEQALTAEGVQRRVKPEMDIGVPLREDGGVVFDKSRLRGPQWKTNIVGPTPQTATFPHNKKTPQRADSGAVMSRRQDVPENSNSRSYEGIVQSPDQDEYVVQSPEQDVHSLQHSPSKGDTAYSDEGHTNPTPPHSVQSPDALVQSPDPWSPPVRHPRQNPRSPDHTGKGQAHDPLAEFHFLHIGTGMTEAEEEREVSLGLVGGEDSDRFGPGHGSSGGGGGAADAPTRTRSDSDLPPFPSERRPTVCESPPATDDNIYDKAYDEQVQKIRANTMNATLYLTRRVGDAGKYTHAADVLGGLGTEAAGWAGQAGEAMGKMARKMGEAAGQPQRQHTAPADAGFLDRLRGSDVHDRLQERTVQAKGRAAQGVGSAAQGVGAFAAALQAKMGEVKEESERARKEEER